MIIFVLWSDYSGEFHFQSLLPNFSGIAGVYCMDFCAHN